MPPEVMALLYDIQKAANLARKFTEGKSFAEYQTDDLLHSAVERQFEIVGEAMTQLRKRDSSLAERFTDYRAIIAFRNLLIHGYAAIVHEKVWDIIENKLPTLIVEVDAVCVSLTPTT